MPFFPDHRGFVAAAIGALIATVIAGPPAAASASAPVAVQTASGPTSAATPPCYAAAREAIRAQGRAVAALVVAGDASALYARLDAAAKREITSAEIAGVLLQLRADQMRARIAESALPLAPDRRFYAANHRTTDGRVLTLQVLFNASGALTSIGLRPALVLPPDPHAGYRLRTRLRLPFWGQWWVFWGGDEEIFNYHVVAPDQRHALDLVIWRDGSTHRGTGASNSDYYVWNHRVRSPAGATVVEPVDGVRDNTPAVDLANPHDPAGNHVVLRLASGEYALLAHMQRGSVRVKVGQHVRVGQVLGLVGNSGNSSEPHLHFHVQDRAGLFGAALGLPLNFAGYTADGRFAGANGSPQQGEFIRSAR